jgi:hypothetical protein
MSYVVDWLFQLWDRVSIIYLLLLLKALPHTIPIGVTHNFIGYVPDPQEVIDTGCTKAVVSHTLEISFGARKMPGPAGAKMIIAFKSRGVALEEVTTVLRDHITGNGGMNLLLTLWVDDLIEGATAAITTAGGRVIFPSVSHFSFHDLCNIFCSGLVRSKLPQRNVFWKMKP